LAKFTGKEGATLGNQDLEKLRYNKLTQESLKKKLPEFVMPQNTQPAKNLASANYVSS
jgi:hypothetical protein